MIREPFYHPSEIEGMKKRMRSVSDWAPERHGERLLNTLAADGDRACNAVLAPPLSSLRRLFLRAAR